MHDPGKTFKATHPTIPGEVICDDYSWKRWEEAGWVKKPESKAEKSEAPPKK